MQTPNPITVCSSARWVRSQVSSRTRRIGRPDRVPEPIRDAIRANAATLDRIIDIATDFADHGDPRIAAMWIQVAGHFAWMNHHGRHLDPRLERLLLRLSG